MILNYRNLELNEFQTNVMNIVSSENFPSETTNANSEQNKIFWIHDVHGRGKTTLGRYLDENYNCRCIINEEDYEDNLYYTYIHEENLINNISIEFLENIVKTKNTKILIFSNILPHDEINMEYIRIIDI